MNFATFFLNSNILCSVCSWVSFTPPPVEDEGVKVTEKSQSDAMRIQASSTTMILIGKITLYV